MTPYRSTPPSPETPLRKPSSRLRSRIMRGARALGWLGVIGVASTGLGAKCVTAQNARSVLDVAEMACILFHEDIADDAALAHACNISDALIPELRKILSARKAAAAKKMSAGVAPSASCK